MAYAILTPEALRESLSQLHGWQLADSGDALVREFRFGSFAEAFAFMTRCALVAERLDHHPEWFNVYSRVSVRLTTHVVKGLTELDIKLASAMTDAARRAD
ncbi:4a-hydroxytetrahydrobiopterin dehydratase [Ciceribacter sp. L1K23]|uniref:4a-hydroxytetrahydrobiopterin dehydratase n=1 Tax=Ciceribacter sp. L1K23 TaxID=2820276 RepID=UPI001B830380|nr:4a-hydroxytetrahydrobiopterin dehydratase [Ciceribacter sp. L1K23]MBR0554133.1 4a-hydroxytetrahydrobiopterin dehydratase [Ciceribacter sp. L1K23]